MYPYWHVNILMGMQIISSLMLSKSRDFASLSKSAPFIPIEEGQIIKL